MILKGWFTWRFYYWRMLLANYGEYELRLLRQYVPRDRLAIDVGANNGIYAYHLSRYARSVVAFEPNMGFGRALRVLPRNVTVRFEALSSATGALPLHIPAAEAGEAEGWATLEATDLPVARSIDVPVRRLDDLDLGQIGFIKIDVEGHEMAVLAGATATIRRDRPTLLVEAEDRHRPGATAELFRWAEEQGYRGWFFQKGRAVPVEEFRLSEHQGDHIRPGELIRPQELNYINNFLLVPAEPS
jgi:FkbM family methyltransferase